MELLFWATGGLSRWGLSAPPSAIADRWRSAITTDHRHFDLKNSCRKCRSLVSDRYRTAVIPSKSEGTNLGVFVPIWLVSPRCEATNLGVFDHHTFDESLPHNQRERERESLEVGASGASPSPLFTMSCALRPSLPSIRLFLSFHLLPFPPILPCIPSLPSHPCLPSLRLKSLSVPHFPPSHSVPPMSGVVV